MASVTSLGVHQPIGLRRAIHEQILPPGPSPELYTWDLIPERNDDIELTDDELLVTKTSVLWSQGGIFQKSFSFASEKEPISHALITHFPTPERNSKFSTPDNHDGKSNKKGRRKDTLSKALVVFLETQAHIFFLDGTSHIVHMPFEVESACAAPCGVIIQRKSRADNLSPVALKFPRVPPNSFVTSLLSPIPQRTAQLPFSTEGLGKPKVLPLRLSSTLENMWDPPLASPDSRWPRLVCLTDPLLELGLVVTQPDKSGRSRRRQSFAKAPFLDPAEEILHIEAIRQTGQSASGGLDGLILAVTANRETNMYTVWRMTYLEPQDIFSRHPKQPKSNSRRRSSMQPGMNSGAATPVHSGFRESLGPQLPVKKTRRSERVENPLEKALSIDADRSEEAARRQSRRVSSRVARADLSASHERGAFVDQSIITHPGGRRIDSHGSQRGRVSGGFMPMNLSGTHSQHLNSLLEGPTDDILDSLRAGGDFEGFRNIALEDSEVDGLAREIRLSKIHSIPMENANVRYSLADQPAKCQSKVFIVVGPPFAVDEQDRTYLIVCIQDPMDKRLQLLGLHVQTRKKPAKGKGKLTTAAESDIVVTWGPLRRAQSVVDSCGVVDGDQSMILILSENIFGQREMSIQGPWSELTKIRLPLLSYDNVNSLEYSGRNVVNKDHKNKRSTGVGVPGAQLEAVCHSQGRGMVDIRDRDGRYHRIQIQLQPSVAQVREVLRVCRSILPDSHGERMLAGWWHIMQWMGEHHEMQVANLEWSSLVVELFVFFLALDPSSVQRRSRSARAKEQVPSGSPRDSSSWDQMQSLDTPQSAIAPAWMQTYGWRWLMDKTDIATAEAPGELSFISQHISLAKEFMATREGMELIGEAGYFPTAVGRILDSRRTAAWSIIMGLHLLLEEQKLDTMAAESLFPGPADLRMVVCQIARWLKWHDLVHMYELGLQSVMSSSHDGDLDLSPPLPQPGEFSSILDWIQGQLCGQPWTAFPTLASVYSLALQQSTNERLGEARWASITPRTFMFRNFFKMLSSLSNHADVVETMHRCGVTPEILDTLPEAILVPLQDAISMCQSHPPSSWSKELLQLVNRADINMVLKPEKSFRSNVLAYSNPNHKAKWDVHLLCRTMENLGNHSLEESGEGHERQAVVRALFRDDRRLNEAQSLLSTQKPRVLRLDPHPRWTDAEYLEKQKELATTVATGTLAIPAGRGMLYYGMRFPLLTQKFQVGGFQLSCTVKPANVSVSVDKTMFTEEKVNWAFFHQGVAGGLAISPHAKGIDSSWILYNRPSNEHNNRHAGFMLALGLNGHLKSMAKWLAFKYLTPKHAMTSVGILLGLGVSYLGTMDSLIVRLVSVHVTKMLPQGTVELNISHVTQTAGIMAIGLLYYNTQHRRISETMLSEIEHVDDENEEDPLRNEGYRLAAGFALGFVNLGKGSEPKGFHTMRLTEKLLTVASSSKKVELVNVLDRSAAGAVVAIALIYMKSEDHIVARKVDVPDSVAQFDYVRPDILLLRTVAKHLILWSRIEPTIEWIHRGLPVEYHSLHRAWTSSTLKSSHLPFFSILAGLCFSMALRHSGSGNEKVRNLLVLYLDGFMRILQQPVREFDGRMARTNVHMCVDMLALSCATVMAGSGDLMVLRRLRALHGRDDGHTTYGSHLAAHLAIGTLFLGCGTTTFGTSDLAIASLLLSFYPLFPATVQDNRSHLQAFRHFWVLATEPRCLIVKDMATGQPVSVPVLIQMKRAAAPAPASSTALDVDMGAKTMPVAGVTATPDAKSRGRGQHSAAAAGSPLPSTSVPPNKQAAPPSPIILRRQTPCILPPLEEIAAVRTDAAALGYWDLTIDFSTGGGGGKLKKQKKKKNMMQKGKAAGDDGGDGDDNDDDDQEEEDMVAAFRANQCLHLRRRPARDSVFGSTLQALGRRDDAAVAAATAAKPSSSSVAAAASVGLGAAAMQGGSDSAGLGQIDGEADPLEWVFGLPALREVPHTDRAVVLDRCSYGDEGSCALDSRLVLEEAVESGGRDELVGLRVLFEWAEKRGVEDGGRKAAGGRDKGKGKGKGREVQIKEPGGDSGGSTTPVDLDVEEGWLREVESVGGENGWWLKDSVIEMLKGKAWLASQTR